MRPRGQGRPRVGNEIKAVPAFTLFAWVEAIACEPLHLDFSDHQEAIKAAKIHLQVLLAGRSHARQARVSVLLQADGGPARLGLWTWSTDDGWIWRPNDPAAPDALNPV